MDKEELLLLQVCKGCLNEAVQKPDESIDWQRFFTLAKKHNLTAISYCVFQENKIQPPQAISDMFLNSFLDIVYISEKQSQALSELKYALEGCQCPYILFKGALLRNLYPVPESRSMGDIDLLIKQEDKKKAEKALTQLGFEHYSSDGAVDSFQRESVVLEVHTKLSGYEDRTIFSDAFSYAHFDGMTGELDDSYHLAYMIYHTATHLKYTGAGIRLVLDIAIFLKKRNVDMDKVFELVSEYKLEKFTEVILSVSKQWFGYGKLYTENTEKVQKYLIEDGMFGSMKEGIKATLVRLRQCGVFDSDSNKSTSATMLKLRLAFPSYSTLRKAEYIKFLDGRPYLLPYAWGYRLAYNLKHRRSKIAERLKNIDDENMIALAEEELAFFEEIGLE